MKNETIGEIKISVSHGKIREAIEMANNFIFSDKQIGEDFKNSFISISGDYYSLKNQYINGIINFEDCTLFENRIKHRLLSLLDLINTQKSTDEKVKKPASSSLVPFENYSNPAIQIFKSLDKSEDIIITIKKNINEKIIRIKKTKDEDRVLGLEFEVQKLSFELEIERKKYEYLFKEYINLKNTFKIKDYSKELTLASAAQRNRNAAAVGIFKNAQYSLTHKFNIVNHFFRNILKAKSYYSLKLLIQGLRRLLIDYPIRVFLFITILEAILFLTVVEYAVQSRLFKEKGSIRSQELQIGSREKMNQIIKSPRDSIKFKHKDLPIIKWDPIKLKQIDLPKQIDFQKKMDSITNSLKKYGLNYKDNSINFIK